MIYLDNGATTYPKPQGVRQAVARALAEFGANPGRGGFAMSVRTGQGVYDCRRMAADLFGARGPECVVFQPNCTQALNLVIKGSLRSGDHVVVSDLEHNAVMRPLEALKSRGVSWTAAQVTPGDNDATLDAFRKAMGPNTKLLVCTQASNVFGIRVPVERLAALCHQYGVKLCVDGAQSAGVVPINMERDGIDYLCCAGHKGLYGPMGTGLLIFRDPADKLATLVEGGTGTQSRSYLQPEDPPERYEAGTVNVPGILGLRAGIAFVQSRTPEKLYQEEMAKAAYLYGRLSQLKKVRLYTKAPEIPWFVPVVSFNVEGISSEEVGNLLAKRDIAVRCGLHCAPAAHEKMGTLETGTVRVSLSAFTRREELDALARAVGRM
ncbi:aminotransferase class V-fold PLP-dependent enzyme [Acutalibacter sp. 1XD8-33]|uniref:aminotransferase class V-fold PLP-dependent enzyme n=1 Tax=Acutalibacter sp. 1XD8-33 TaxID=2320081 RepID=UPI000EA0FA4B|nr:aminotransferase class V-fold PLP-dependent enzyme [Acutalibacter sp. 1XD8-33]RKJ41330.1 aminotransferase class V-fold PLP-dependent enzyme [Acutalibacter sp. 1XD8-33]